MSKRLIALVTSALLIGGLFVGAPVRVQAVADTVYVADVASAGAGGSCSAPDYATGVLDDDESIQDAIDAVDASPSLTTVYLCAGTYNITATLEPDQDITFIGAGAATTILDGGAIYTGGNYVSGGVSILFSFDPVTVEGLTFQHGANVLAYVEGDYRTWGGGAINSITVTVIDSTFTQNHAVSFGGAIWTYGPSTIQGDSVFTGNTASWGGAIYNYSGADLTIQGNSVFTSNYAGTFGGAIFSWGKIFVTNGTFTDNISACYGGAINSYNDVTVTSSAFMNNASGCNGGAISAGTVTVTNSNFSDNSAEDDGGAIRAYTVTATNSTFTSNTSVNDDGGAIHADNDATVTRSIFTGNTANEGGAIDATTATVTNSTFTKNTVTVYGGAIYANTATVSSSRFTDNKADVEGGAILAGPGTIITRSRFTRNTAGEHGGAMLLYAPNSADLQQLRGNTFMRNSAPAGGAITLGPCVVPSRSEAARVERANRFSGNRATEQRRTQNIERWEDGC